MNILGIGPLELVLIVIILLLFFGPQDLAALARKAGDLVRKVKQSEVWKAVRQSDRTIRQFGEDILSDTDLDDFRKQVKELDFRPAVDEELAQLVTGKKPGLSEKKAD